MQMQKKKKILHVLLYRLYVLISAMNINSKSSQIFYEYSAQLAKWF